ncbi:MAG: hypothetical protein JSS16_11635 [Proteobacteria bacterium]|nr:hypothetical protein [Pseudomonadota bacterium]
MKTAWLWSGVLLASACNAPTSTDRRAATATAQTGETTQIAVVESQRGPVRRAAPLAPVEVRDLVDVVAAQHSDETSTALDLDALNLALPCAKETEDAGEPR